MAHIHGGLEGRLYGKLETDEQFTQKLKRVMELISQGKPVSWYRSKHNILMIHRNQQWWSMEKLAQVEPLYEWW